MTSQRSPVEFPSEVAIPGLVHDDGPDPAAASGGATRDASSWGEAAVAHLSAVFPEEVQIVGAYREFADVGGQSIRYLVDLMLDDEKRHHRILIQLFESLSANPSKTGSSNPLPALSVEPDLRVAMIDATRSLAQAEEAESRALKTLRRDLRPVEDETLWPALVEMIADDCEKHRHLLGAIQRVVKHLPEAPNQAGINGDERDLSAE